MKYRNKIALMSILILAYLAGTIILHDWLSSIVRRYDPLGYHLVFSACMLLCTGPLWHRLKTFRLGAFIVLFVTIGYMSSVMANLLMDWITLPERFFAFTEAFQRKFPQIIIAMFAYPLLFFGWLQGAIIGIIVYLARR